MQEIEEQLVKGCLAGIPAFQQMLYKRYAPKMLTVCLRYAYSREEAEDVLQEGFIIVFDKMAQFRMQGSFEGWIRRIMVNKSLEHLRKAPGIFPVLNINYAEDKFISKEDVLNTIASNELLTMIQELPPMYKMVFNLYVFEGMTHKEIAALVGIAEGTSKSNLSDARAILKRRYTGIWIWKKKPFIMSNGQMENEIDDIFKQAIEPVNTEPSDKFWRKAAEDVIARKSKLNERNASHWRTVAFILAAGLLLLGYFTYRIESGINNTSKTSKTVDKVQTQVPLTNNNVIANNNISYPVSRSGAGSSGNNKIKINHKDKKHSSTNSALKNISRINLINVQNNLVASSKPYAKNENPKKTDESFLIANNKKESDQPEVLQNQENNISLPNLNPPEVSSSTPITIQKNTEKTLSKIPADTNTAIPDVLNAIIDTPKSLPYDGMLTGNNPGRISVSGFFSPDFLTGYMFKCPNSVGDAMENTIKQGESQIFSFTAGLRAEYQISSRFSIGTGMAYQSFSFNVSPCNIYAQKQSDGNIGYSIPTSSGVVNCPYYGYAKVGDSLKMSATSSRNYLEIPIHAKFFAINNSKFKFYLAGGVEANFALGEETYMNWEDYGWSNNGTAIVNTTNGSERMYFSYYVGLGVDYRIGKNLSVYLEPGMHYALTPVDNNIDVISYPRLLSATGGLTYYLN